MATSDKVRVGFRQALRLAGANDRWRRVIDLAAQEMQDAVGPAVDEATRTQYRMRRAGGPAVDVSPAGIRGFHPGADDQALLSLNNAAFRWHPEQGRWDQARLSEACSRPGFDPSSVLLLETDGHVRGFVWTRVDRSPGSPVGEIWVIAVAGDAAGGGLGRRLLRAGLSYLRQEGCASVELYVDAMNRRALHLFVEEGFVVERVERFYGSAPLRPDR